MPRRVSIPIWSTTTFPTIPLRDFPRMHDEAGDRGFRRSSRFKPKRGRKCYAETESDISGSGRPGNCGCNRCSREQQLHRGGRRRTSRDRSGISDLVGMTLYYKINQWCTFGLEPIYYGSRAVPELDKFGTIGQTRHAFGRTRASSSDLFSHSSDLFNSQAWLWRSTPITRIRLCR